MVTKSKVDGDSFVTLSSVGIVVVGTIAFLMPRNKVVVSQCPRIEFDADGQLIVRKERKQEERERRRDRNT